MEELSPAKLPDLPLERRWHQQTHPSPVVVALIRRDSGQTTSTDPTSHYLLIKRIGNPYKGCWALVGGKWEFGETLHEAITREVKEETGLDAQFVAIRGLVSERVIPTHDEASGAHFFLFVCELSADDGHAEEQKEGAISWFTRTEIEQLKAEGAIIPSDYAMIDSFADTIEVAPYVEAEMSAPIGNAGDAPVRLLSFEHINNL